MSNPACTPLAGRRALVTGAGRRIGATIAARLHAAGATVGIHYRTSAMEATTLRDRLNDTRSGSAEIFAADLGRTRDSEQLLTDYANWCGGLDVLVNNASSFFPTPLGTISETQWDELIGSNLKGPLFLSQAAYPLLARNAGAIVNIVDVHAQRPLRDHTVYGVAKAGLAMLTRSLAKEMAPAVRVNGVSPGAVLWPEDGITAGVKEAVLKQIPLARTGHPDDIADCVLYLVDARYVTGQIVAVDGGRSIGWS